MGYDKNYIQLVYDDFNIWFTNRNGKNHFRKNNSSDSIGQIAWIYPFQGLCIGFIIYAIDTGETHSFMEHHNFVGQKKTFKL